MGEKYMKELPQTSVRKMRYGEILNFIMDCSIIGKGVEKERLIAEFCIRYGCARRKVFEYISDLLNSDRIKEKIDGDKVIYFREISDKALEEIKNGA